LYAIRVQEKMLLKCNWLGGTLSGPKRSIFRHTWQIFLTKALLWPTKIRFFWQKWPLFCLRRDHANRLHQNKQEQCFPAKNPQQG
jgi:hypothetical protein